MRIENDTGLSYDLVQDDFSGGLQVPGPPDASLTPPLGFASDTIDPNALAEFKGCRSDKGLCEPMIGSSLMTAFTGAQRPIAPFACVGKYVNGTTTQYLIIGKNFTSPTQMELYTFTLGGGFARIGSGMALDGGVASDHWRMMVQIGEYLYISSNEETSTRGSVYRYTSRAITGSNAMVKAGTPPPTNAPTMATAAGAGGLTIGFTYSYVYGWEYGAAYGSDGHLGEGWIQSAGTVTPTAGNTFINVTMDTAVPTGYGHVVARLVYRNNPEEPGVFRLVVRQTNFASATYQDTMTDAVLKTQTRQRNPRDGGTTTAPVTSPFIIPNGDVLAWHEGRLYWLDTRTNRVYWSRLDGYVPRPDQVFASQFVAFPVDAGKATFVKSRQSPGGGRDLYVTLENAVFRQTVDPSGDKPAAFSSVAWGAGIMAKRSLADASDLGLLGIGRTGLVVVDQGGNVQTISDNLRGIITGATEAEVKLAAGGWDPIVGEYVATINDARIVAFDRRDLLMRNGRETVAAGNNDLDAKASWMGTIDNALFYADGPGQTGVLYRKSTGSLGITSAGGANMIARDVATGFIGKRNCRQTLVEIFVEFTKAIELTTNDVFNVYKDGDKSSAVYTNNLVGTTNLLRLVIPMATAQIDFNTIALRLRLASATGALAIVKSIRAHVVYEPDRLVPSVEL